MTDFKISVIFIGFWAWQNYPKVHCTIIRKSMEESMKNMKEPASEDIKVYYKAIIIVSFYTEIEWHVLTNSIV